MVIDETYAGENLVFLVGCPRSGTTWLQRLLASHPQVKTGQESHLFDFYVGPQLHRWSEAVQHAAGGRGGVGIGCYVSREAYLEIVRGYMLALLRPMLAPVQPGEFFLEKTPAHAYYVSEIHRFLPRARIIHLVRDPRDVTASLLAASRSWGASWAPGTAQRAAMMWRDHIMAAKEGAAPLGSSEFMEVRFEELYRSPVSELRRLTDFLGLPWSSAELAAAIVANRADEVRTGGGTGIPLGGAFLNQTGRVVEPKDFVRRGEPGGWRQDLSLIDQLAVQRVAWVLMEGLGYANDQTMVERVVMRLLKLRHRNPFAVAQQEPVS